MNKPIRKVAVAALILFGILLVNATYTFLFRHEQLSSSDYNRRVRDEQFGRNRGAIMAGSTAIADTRASSDSMRFQRYYSNGPMYAACTGWYSYNFAQSGLERTYNAELAGTADSLTLQRTLDQISGKIPRGATVETTIDPKMQQAAYNALGNATGAVVALDTKTGAIKAMVSTPSYDPNLLASHDLLAAQEAWQDLNNDPAKPLANRATREIYPPGSTFKVIVSAAALENGIEPDTKLETPVTLKLPGTNSTLPNQSATCKGQRTLTQALDNSCNTTFAQVGMDLGEEKISEMATKFGFGKKPITEVPSSASRFPTGMDKASLALSSIGQFDVAATPLQMAMVAATIANDGVRVQPYLVETVRGSDLKVLESHGKSEQTRVLSSETARKLQDMLVSVVENGSGKNAKIAGVKVGGKTGTAQHGTGAPPYGSFLAIVPEKNLAVYVFVDSKSFSAQQQEYAGSQIAAPIARKVIEAGIK